MTQKKSIKVLIIEDEEALLSVLEHKLVREGYKVSLARDGEQGLSQVKSMRPDVILLDILMPKLDGFGVLESLNADGTIPDLPVIIISNSGQPVEIDRALKLGARDYLVKAEFSPEEVVEKVRKVINPTDTGNGDGKVAGNDGQTEGRSASILPPNSGAAMGGQLARILIIEDDQFLRDLMERKLIKEGFDVETAIDGEAGLQKIKSGKPDLVLLDVILPGLDGFSILEKVKADATLANIPIILLTNLGQRDDVEKGSRLGAVGYLVKAHFTPGDIVEKVKSVLRK